MSRNKSKQRRTALVTGASQGLGAAIALRLARDGYDVAVTELTPEPLGEVVSKLEALGARAVPVVLDVRSQDSIESAFRLATSAIGPLDVLVNNAGVTLRRDAVDVSREEWDAVNSVNLTGTFFMCQQMGRHLIADKRPGCIVSLASTHGVVSLAQRSTYGITKGAIIHMTRMLAFEWAAHGVRVNAIAPGTIETPSRAAYFKEFPQARKDMLARVPAGHFGTPEDVAGAVAYLAGADGAFVTGQTLLLDGGLTTY
ncbi:MAG TPA: glucose 1-dehydrogenase [Burkholderiales bacterium]|nr:glucose 1-dehydrogenase [Burkholderiales bacterium]